MEQEYVFRNRKGKKPRLTENGCLDSWNTPMFLGDPPPERSKNTERDSVRQLISQFIL